MFRSIIETALRGTKLANSMPTISKNTTVSLLQTHLVQTRNKMKTHHSAAKRFIKTGNGYKRKQAGRKHGNGGFSSNQLRHLDSFVPVTNKGGHLKKLKQYLN